MEDHNTRKDIRKRQVTLINAYPLGTGIGEYVRDLMKINSIEVISLIFNQNTMKNFSYPGVIKIGRFPHFQNKFDFLLNAYFQRLSFSRVFKSLNDRTLKQNIVHYADPSISPATNFDLSLVTIHDTIFFDKTLAGGGPFNLRFRYVIKNLKIYKQFENIITISNKVKKELTDLGWNNSISVVPYPVSESFKFLNAKKEMRSKLGLPQDKILILSVSNDVPRKNLKTVDKTMKLLDHRFKLIRVGTKLGQSITFDYIDNQEKMNMIYNASDVLLFPSLDEGFGRPLVEAMATGLPVVASNIDVLKEMGKDAPLFVEPTPEECKRGILEVLADSVKYSKNGIEQSRRFSFQTFENRMEQVYRNMIKNS